MNCKNEEKWPYPSKISFLTVEAMEKLPTHRLNAYRKKLYKLTGVEDDYVWDCECRSCMEEKAWHEKATQQIERTKKILKNREHVK